MQLVSPKYCSALSRSAALWGLGFFFFFGWLNNGVIFTVTFGSCWENAYHPVGSKHAGKAALLQLRGRQK